jgi:hypothetical protein
MRGAAFQGRSARGHKYAAALLKVRSMFERLLRKNVGQGRKQRAVADPEAAPRAGEREGAAGKEASEPLDREQVVQLIARHAHKLADLANEQGCTTLHHFLLRAAQQAERDLGAARKDSGSNVS